MYNHGASLQEYALLKFLNTQGFDAITINYQPDYLANNYKFFKVPVVYQHKNILYKSAYVLAKLPSKLKSFQRYKRFEDFTEKYIPTTRDKFATNEELKHLTKRSAYICGSDQIWNTLFNNGKDKAFYLDFAPDDSLKISYAASFATKKIENGLENFVRNNVEKLNFVSVRESSAVKILKDLGVNSVQVLDPVFLLDSEDWESSFIQKSAFCEKFLFVYDFDNNPQIKEFSLYLAEKYNLKIYSTNKLSYADRSFWNDGPVNFLNLVFHAEFVLTNSFHALAFSLIFNKQMYVFNRSTAINTRMFDLLLLFNVSDRMIHVGDKKDKLDLVLPIIYDDMKKHMENKKTESRGFLLNALQHA